MPSFPRYVYNASDVSGEQGKSKYLVFAKQNILIYLYCLKTKKSVALINFIHKGILSSFLMI